MKEMRDLKIFSVVKSDSGLSEFVVALEEVVVRSHVTKDIEVRETGR